MRVRHHGFSGFHVRAASVRQRDEHPRLWSCWLWHLYLTLACNICSKTTTKISRNAWS